MQWARKLARIALQGKSTARLYETETPDIDGIIVYFNKTPPEIVCPHFWELRWAFGCYFDCDYCYLRGTGQGYTDKYVGYRPESDVIAAIDKAFRHEYFMGNPSVFNSGELSDSLVMPSQMEKIADKFEEQNKHKLLLLTKSSNVNFLMGKPRRQTIVSFSLNAPEAWRRWEHKTPHPEKRIEAAKAVNSLGYETRIRIDPIFPIESWKQHYGELISDLLSKLTPERITLGTPRGLSKTLMFSKERSWAKFFTEESSWGKKLSTALREEIYLFFIQMLSDSGLDKSKISICKETTEMWHRLGINPEQCKCNCVW